jgi:hypothetical protein
MVHRFLVNTVVMRLHIFVCPGFCVCVELFGSKCKNYGFLFGAPIYQLCTMQIYRYIKHITINRNYINLGIIDNSVNFAGLLFAYTHVRHPKWSQYIAPDDTAFYRWFHNCGFSICDLLFINIVALRIGLCCSDFWKICSIPFWYDLYLTAIGLILDGSSTVHNYTQTIHITKQSTRTIYRTIQFTNWVECGPCPVFARYTLVFALQPRKKHVKTSVRVASGKEYTEQSIYVKNKNT